MGRTSAAIAFVIVLLLILYLIIFRKWHSSVNRIFNSNLVSLYTPEEVFGTDAAYTAQALRGFDIMKERGLLILAMVRDVETQIPHMRRKTTLIGQFFQDYRVLILENDSTDRTRQLLLEWARDDPHVTVLGCGENADKCSLKLPKTASGLAPRRRIEKMVMLRNEYLDYVKTHPELHGFEYTAMWDLDILGSAYIDGIAHSIAFMEETPNVNAVCANGVYHESHLYNPHYDLYAAVMKGEKYRGDLHTLHIIKTLINLRHLRKGQAPFEVESCFGGFTLYKTSSLLPDHVRYDMSPEDWNVECEHVRLHSKMGGGIYLNPSMTHLVLENE